MSAASQPHVHRNLLIHYGSILYIISAVMWFQPQPVVAAPDAASCECPELKCDPCSEQKGITFYAQKCGGGESRVMSCARPTCEPLADPPASCKIAAKKTENKKEAEVKIVEPQMVAAKPVAAVKTVKGEAWVIGPEGNRTELAEGMTVHETETLITGRGGRVQMEFQDGNLLMITPDSRVQLSSVVYKPDLNQKRTVIDLIKGKVRNKVNQKYRGANNYYRVRTKVAVAGVRGTDFAVSFDDSQKQVAQVQTIEGEVEFFSGDREKSVQVAAGQAASYVVASNSSVFNDTEIKEFVARGYMTPVYQMTAKEIKELEWETNLANADPARHIASKSDDADYVCQSPKARLNECAWTCKNNPRGADRCRTDLPQVNCVRSRCNANGEWADESRLPASFYNSCEPHKVKVGPCDY